jgi:catechol 2,3-dioxygenase-like lactoylglutathione lyase family enzyme
MDECGALGQPARGGSPFWPLVHQPSSNEPPLLPLLPPEVGRIPVPAFPAITYVAFTVSDLDRSVPRYQALFGTKPVVDADTGPFRHVVWALGGGTLGGLHQFPSPSSTDPFTEDRPGLDHLASACANRAELAIWESRLNDLGTKNGGIVDAP